MIKVILSLLALSSDDSYAPHIRDKVASSIAKGERRAQARQPHRRELCDRCHRPPVQCVCASLPRERIRTATNVLILQHPSEFRRKTFSTVPLLPLVLENVKIHVGQSFEPDTVEPIREALARGETPLVLFPGPGAITLDNVPLSEQETSAKTATNAIESQAQLQLDQGENQTGTLLVLIDGTWTQARSMARHSPLLLECCQQVQFTSDSSSIYDAVRKEPEAHCVSTLEACAQALTLLEPDPAIAITASEHLHEALRSLVKVQLRHNEYDTRDPRFMNRGKGDAAAERMRRRLEVEHELFGAAKDLKTTTKQFSARPSVDLGSGATMRSLRPSDATFLDTHWEKRSKSSFGMIRKQIQDDECCLGIEQDGTMCASILRYRNGSLGMLFVGDDVRRRGFGSSLLREATRILEERGEECFAFILDGNAASEALFSKQGWVRADPSVKKGTGKRRAPRKWVKQ